VTTPSSVLGRGSGAALASGLASRRNGEVALEAQPEPPVATARRRPQPMIEPERPGEGAPSPRCRWNADYL
jgi:hypothetical protein